MGNVRPWPVASLLAAYRHLRGDRPLAPTTRRSAILSARTVWLNEPALDRSPTPELAEHLAAFQAQVDPWGWHPDAPRRHAGILRHGLAHLLRGSDPLPTKLARCVRPGGDYFVLGLGRRFWAAVAQALDPDRLPDATTDVRAGLRRVGRGDAFAEAVETYASLIADHPDLTAGDLDDFFTRVARMSGRELFAGDLSPDEPADAVRHLLRRVRTTTPLRPRLTRHRAEAISPGPPPLAGLAALDDADAPALSPDDRAQLLADVAVRLTERFRVHPLELPDLLALAAERNGREPADERERRFRGFGSETFRFLTQLSDHNHPEWMRAERERYRFAVRGPLLELCSALAERYAGPVLLGEYGWEFDTEPKAGRALTSICKNDFGRAGPYQPALGLRFGPIVAGRRGTSAFFVRAEADGVRFGWSLGRGRAEGRRLRQAVQAHGERLWRAVEGTGATLDCRWEGDGRVRLRGAADLRAWAGAKEPRAERFLPADSPTLRGEELVNEVLLFWDRLIPLAAAALEADPLPVLSRRAGEPAEGPRFGREAFARETGLSDTWLDRTLELLRLKKQLILQGVPGTGKTHVARSLARLLSNGRSDAVRLVQFHPGYSYEEFVEGIRPRSVEVSGRSEVAYGVTDGLLAAFAAQASARPADTHVLLIDEVNRGNLPRVFGELLYLLEYRDEAVTLPYSKREFRLPPNLYLLATMNPQDRSAAGLDQALRRRFSFVEMPPDAAVLARWLEAHPPEGRDEALAVSVVRLFEALNRRLARDLGPERQVGHSYFLIPALNRAKLRAVWEHHVEPLLSEAFAGQAGRLEGYRLERLMGEKLVPAERGA